MSPTSVEFSWAAAALNDPFDYYEVFYRDPATGDRISAARIFPDETRRYLLERLDPSTVYTIEVVTVLEASGQFPRQESEEIRTIDIETCELSIYAAIIWGEEGWGRWSYHYMLQL